MAMRVSLVPVPLDMVSLFCRAVAAESDAEFDEATSQLRARGAQNQLLLQASHWARFRLSLDAFMSAGRESEYYAWTTQRPYLITAPTPTEAAEQVTAARQLRTQRDMADFFEWQLRALDAELFEPQPGDERMQAADDPISQSRRSAMEWRVEAFRQREDRWLALVPKIRKVRAMHRALLGGRPFDTDNRTWDVVAGIDVLTEETSRVTIEGTKLVKQYGAEASLVLAMVGVYCEPVWWLGRNFSLSLLPTYSFSLPRYLHRRRYRHIIGTILSPAILPAELLQDIAVTGFEKGMPRVCEGYATGLHFPSSAIPDLLSSLRSERDGWIRLCRDATDYEDHEARELLAILEEALDWAAANNVGLLEADEVSTFK